MAIIEEITDSCQPEHPLEKPALIANNQGNDDLLAELDFLRTQNAQYATELALKDAENQRQNAEIRELRRGRLDRDTERLATTIASNDGVSSNTTQQNIV